MSAYNTNFLPPAPNGSLINGQQQQQQQHHQLQQEQQQSLEQQRPQQQLQPQQQQQMQQQQQLQQQPQQPPVYMPLLKSVPPQISGNSFHQPLTQYSGSTTPAGNASPQFNNNIMNRFLPPALNNGPASQAESLENQQRPPGLNGPTVGLSSAPPAAKPPQSAAAPPSTTAPPPAVAQPPATAPPSINSASSAATPPQVASSATPVTNGNNGALSANSSRTASPGVSNAVSSLKAVEAAVPQTLSPFKPQYGMGPLGKYLLTAPGVQAKQMTAGLPVPPQKPGTRPPTAGSIAQPLHSRPPTNQTVSMALTSTRPAGPPTSIPPHGQAPSQASQLSNHVSNQATSQASGQQFNQATSQSSGQQFKQATSQSSGQQFNQATNQASGQQINQATNQASGQQINQATNQASGQQFNQATSQASGQQFNQATSQSSGQQFNQVTSQSSGQQFNQATNQASGQQINQATSQSSGQQFNQATNQASGQQINQATSQSSGQQFNQATTQSSGQQFNQGARQGSRQQFNQGTSQASGQQFNQAPSLKSASHVHNLTNSMQNMTFNPSNSSSSTPSYPQTEYRGVATGQPVSTQQFSDPKSLIEPKEPPSSLGNLMAEPFNANVPTSKTAGNVFGAMTAAPQFQNRPMAASEPRLSYGIPPKPLASVPEPNNNAPAVAPPPAALRPPQWQSTGAATPPLPPVSSAAAKPQAYTQPSPSSSLSTSMQMQPPPLAPPQVNQQQQQQQHPLYQQQQQQQKQYPYKQAFPQTLPPQQPATPAPPQSQHLQQQQLQQPHLQHPHQQLSGPGVFGTQQQPLQYQTQTMPPQPSSVLQQGFSRLWGQDTIDLMQNRHILSPATTAPPKIVLHNQFHESINCNPSIIRCTLAKIPESNSLLQKSRLPLGIVVHPFRDVNSLPVIQCANIVRCRLCRTYINPFVYFVDSKMWKCNLCYRVNELPEDFQFDPATKTYGDVTRRPEVRSSTIEFIAPSEYMLRPPQPAIYLFLFDVSIIGQQSGYLETACAVLNRHLDDMPGDARTQVGFLCYDSYVHFYSMAEGLNQPHEMTLLDIEDPFLPRPDSLLVNLKECKELVKDLLKQLPKRFAHTHDPGSALGAALQVAFKLMQASGGRITVFQSCLPNKGPGALEAREDPNNRSANDVAHLNPATDFYKRFALECSGYQIAVDLFLMNQQYSDMATISGVSKHSGGCVHHFPLFQKTKPQMVDSFKQCFKRYLTRKIGFEAVMRIRCTRGLTVHTFHGNFFVRSTDLLSLPNVNPDAGYGMQISYEESLTDVKTICFQAALLYTNSEGERRIRVHTICLPVTASLPEVMHSADSEAIIGLLSKMAVDRSTASSLSDARDAFINTTIDVFNAFKIAQNLPSGQSGQLIAPRSLALLPLYILALLKHPAFRVGTSTRLDDRVFAMDNMKTLPLDQLMKYVYPELYKIDALIYHVRNSNMGLSQNDDEDDDEQLPKMQRLQLSAEHLDSRSIFLMDCGTLIMLYVGLNVPTDVLESLLGIRSTAELGDYVYGLPNVSSVENDALKRFLMHLNYDKPYAPLVQIIRDTSTAKAQFIERLTDDRSESSLSYYEFLQHIRAQVK